MKRTGRTAGKTAVMLVAVIALVLFAKNALAQEFFHGVVFEAEMGTVLGTDDGSVFLLEGKDMAPYLDSFVTVVGEASYRDDGTVVLSVSHVEMDPEDDSEDEDAPFIENEMAAPYGEFDPQ